MKQQILTASNASDLNRKINDALLDGWFPIGSHQVVQTHHQMRYSGMQHKDTVIQLEYSQTVQKQLE